MAREGGGGGWEGGGEGEEAVGWEEVAGGRVVGQDLHAACFGGEAGGESGSSEVPD